MTTYARQGELGFRSAYKLQTRWGLTEAAIFTAESAGGALVAASLLLDAPGAVTGIGLALVAVAIALLLAHLGHRGRAWRAIRNLRGAWISRGTVVLGGVLGLGVLRLALDAWAPGADGATAALGWLLVAGGAFIPLYPGLVQSSSPAIPFWSSGLVPVLSFSQGVATAFVLLPVLGLGDRAVAGAPVAAVAAWLVAANAVVLALHLGSMLRRGGGGAESTRYLLSGQGALFWGGAVVAGIALPFALLLGAGAGGGEAALAIAALARLGGDLALRHAVLKVGMFDPVV